MKFSQQNKSKRRRKQTKELRGEVSELKYKDYDILDRSVLQAANATTSNMLTIAASGAALNYVTVGDGPSELVGREYENVSIHVNGVFKYSPPSSGLAPVEVRVLLVINKTNYEELTYLSTILNQGPTDPQDMWQFQDLTWLDRFIVLRDERFCLHPEAGISTQQAQAWKSVKWNHSLQRFRLGSTTPVAAVNAPNNAAVYLFAISSDNNGYVKFSGTSRFRFRG
jgi:hypothetical protein